MDADQTCEFLLNLIKRSNLNYLVEETAFSVQIKIKKAFIKNKDGSLRKPNFSSDHGIFANSSTKPTIQLPKDTANIQPLKPSDMILLPMDTSSLLMKQPYSMPKTQTTPLPSSIGPNLSKYFPTNQPMQYTTTYQPMKYTTANQSMKYTTTNTEPMQISTTTQPTNHTLIQHPMKDWSNSKIDQSIYSTPYYSKKEPHFILSSQLVTQNISQNTTNYSMKQQQSIVTSQSDQSISPANYSKKQQPFILTPKQDQSKPSTTKQISTIPSTYITSSMPLCLSTSNLDLFPFKTFPRVFSDEDSDEIYTDDDESQDEILKKYNIT